MERQAEPEACRARIVSSRSLNSRPAACVAATVSAANPLALEAMPAGTDLRDALAASLPGLGQVHDASAGGQGFFEAGAGSGIAMNEEDVFRCKGLGEVDNLRFVGMRRKGVAGDAALHVHLFAAQADTARAALAQRVAVDAALVLEDAPAVFRICRRDVGLPQRALVYLPDVGVEVAQLIGR